MCSVYVYVEEEDNIGAYIYVHARIRVFPLFASFFFGDASLSPNTYNHTLPSGQMDVIFNLMGQVAASARRHFPSLCTHSLTLSSIC